MTSKERIKAIEKKQAALAAKIKQAQEALYRLLLESIDRIEKDPAYVEQVFKKYQESAGMKLVTTIATDVAAISGYNYAYFLSFKDELNLSGKDFTKIKGTVDTFIQERIGLKGNKVIADSFLDTLLTDATVKQKVKQQAYTNLLAGEGATTFRKNIKSLVLGEGEKLGALEAHYNTFVYDTYNQVDSALQEQYSEELELTAFVYEGGLISTSREFCKKKNGRVFLKEEALKEWPKDPDLPKGGSAYRPLIDRGKFNCRHSINYLSSRRAMRLREDLEIVSGKLQVKSS
ncbi:hypothetical protein [Pontibacter beigongshangensis]|uniref:hypothetical protein n=1 Tax=Pontibacter beigongshangensis TaxID=2574733 RepID=UPI00164FB395|nr:hypothetical protein [Pontibacter beigongshangensis]